MFHVIVGAIGINTGFNKHANFCLMMTLVTMHNNLRSCYQQLDRDAEADEPMTPDIITTKNKIPQTQAQHKSTISPTNGFYHCCLHYHADVPLHHLYCTHQPLPDALWLLQFLLLSHQSLQDQCVTVVHHIC